MKSVREMGKRKKGMGWQTVVILIALLVLLFIVSVGSKYLGGLLTFPGK